MRQRRLDRTDGLCEMCDAEGLTTLATVVDHIVPLAKGGQDVDANTRNLCDRHHAEVTSEQFGRAAPKAKGVDRNGWPTDASHPWNQPEPT
ncbi:5-methylcytosine-specific restriction enzyme A [Sphingomonas rubra]|uniref:5-methylcytosine-specific restriction enzyme A n=2 Tax=Sphingomonas rubra TaxID=634430 RepID=A0A1I5UTZ6_9SPHN|nr:5-methylcytosine-specific restriction enzyme A [Sphingomonas rubra]